ncbi:MAG: hypothetical protein AAGF12_07895 [Myxococcota bacterium]
MDATLADARALLDDALRRVGTLTDPELAKREATAAVSEALYQTYRAEAFQSDYGSLRNSAALALGAAGRALEILQQKPSTDPALDPVLSQVARAMGVLVRPKASGASLMPIENREPPVDASSARPTLLSYPRDVVWPAYPVSWSAAVLEFPVAPEVEPPPASEAGMAELLALAHAALEESTEPSAVEAEGLDPRREPSAVEAEGLDPRREPSAVEAEGLDPRREPSAVEESGDKPTSPARWVTDDEVRAVQFGTPLSSTDLARRQAKVLFEELGMLGQLRRPRDDQGWLGRAEAERRLFTRLDAIVAVGVEAIGSVVELLGDRPVPDPELTWALLFACGSIEGDDLVDQAFRVVDCAPLSEPTIEDAVADALVHAPNPAIAGRLRSFLDRDGPRQRIAVRVLGRRGGLSAEEIERLSHSRDPALLRCLAIATLRAQGEVDRRTLNHFMHHIDSEVAFLGMVTTVLLNRSGAAQRAFELCRSGRAEHGHAALIYALTGGRDALELLREIVIGAVSKETIAAVGWYGHLELVPSLLGRLYDEDTEIVDASVAALQRLTGANLTPSNPEPDYPAGRVPFGTGTTVRPEDPGPLSNNPEHWFGWWKRWEGKSDRRHMRCRFGREWAPTHDVWELQAATSTPVNRRLAQVELAARLGVRARVDLDAFVSVQQAQVEAVRAEVHQKRGAGMTLWPTAE